MENLTLDKSLQRSIMRGAVRGLLKPALHPRVPIAIQRRVVQAMTAANLRPRGSRVEAIRMHDVPAEKLTPAAGPGDAVLLYLHGGAYVLGSPTGYRNLIGRLATQLGATGYGVDYRLAPEHVYPAAVDDAVAAYRWLLANGAPAERIVVAGDSAGGGLTLATAITLRDAGDPLPAALGLISPWVDLTMGSDSVAANQQIDPMLHPAWGRECGKLYAGDRPVTDPGCSPLNAELAGLPPMVIQFGSDEILFDDATRLADRARAAGVDVTLECFADLWHVFPLHAGIVPESNAAVDRMARSLRTRRG